MVEITRSISPTFRVRSARVAITCPPPGFAAARPVPSRPRTDHEAGEEIPARGVTEADESARGSERTRVVGIRQCGGEIVQRRPPFADEQIAQQGRADPMRESPRRRLDRRGRGAPPVAVDGADTREQRAGEEDAADEVVAGG